MNGFVKVPHLLFEGGFSVWEREMMIYLLDCENRFQREGKWFGLIDEDFINIGFGKDKRVLRETRDSLIAKGKIQFKKGGKGHKSQYMVMLRSDIKSKPIDEPIETGPDAPVANIDGNDEPIDEPIQTIEIREQPTNYKETKDNTMVTKEELMKVYEEGTKNDFERCCNYYLTDYNREATKNGTKQTTIWKVLAAVVSNCGDKYNYTELIKSHI